MTSADDTTGADPGSNVGPTGDQEPDVRFTYANERTFLAWNRTALALIATGVAATQLLPSFEIDYGRRIIGVPLVVLGAIVAIGAYRDWRANQQAMRRNEPLRRSPLPEILAGGIVIIAIVAAVLAAFAAR
jgi:putative membrane protein